MGAAIAIQAANVDQRVSAVIAQSPFSNLQLYFRSGLSLFGWKASLTVLPKGSSLTLRA